MRVRIEQLPLKKFTGNMPLLNRRQTEIQGQQWSQLTLRQLPALIYRVRRKSAHTRCL